MARDRANYNEYQKKYQKKRYENEKYREMKIRCALKSYYQDSVLLSLKRLFYNTCHLI